MLFQTLITTLLGQGGGGGGGVQLDVLNIFTKPQIVQGADTEDAADITWDQANNQNTILQLTDAVGEDRNLTASGMIKHGYYGLYIFQNESGNGKIIFDPAVFKSSEGIAPALTQEVGAEDFLVFYSPNGTTLSLVANYNFKSVGA